ncbi:hypothetical protein [Nocardiopsis sp. CNT-189]
MEKNAERAEDVREAFIPDVQADPFQGRPEQGGGSLGRLPVR